jgi:hypothetical protein
MRTRAIIGLVAALAVAGLALIAPAASAKSTAKSTPKIQPVCVERDLPAGLHLQIGYCP